MKRKQIEQVPPVLPEKKRYGKKVSFVAVAQLAPIGGEETLIVDIFSLKEKRKRCLRYACTRKEYGMFRPDTGTWSSESIKDPFCSPARSRAYSTKNGVIREYADASNTAFEGRETMDAFVFVDYSGSRPQWKVGYSWIEVLKEAETEAAAAKRTRALELRAERLRQRCEEMPEVPEAFTAWALDSVAGVNFLYYKRRGRFVTVRCSHCGEEYDGVTRQKEGFDGWAESFIPTPSSDETARCRCCGAYGLYKPIGRMRGTWGIEKDRYLIQPFRSGIVIRYFRVRKLLRTDDAEQVSFIEICRAFYEGSRKQKDFHKQGGGRTFWDDCNLDGMANIPVKPEQIWPGSWVILEDAGSSRNGLEEYCRHFGENAEPVRYMDTVMTAPYLEMMVRNRLWKAVKAVIRGGEVVKDPEAGKPADLFGIYPYRWDMVKRTLGNVAVLHVLRREREGGYHWKEEQIRKLALLGLGCREELDIAFRYMGIQKFLNRVAEYTGAGFEEAACCSEANHRMNSAGLKYLDYLAMREQAGDDLTDSIIQHPKDLDMAHDEATRRVNAKKEEEHCQMKERQFQDIKRKYPSLHRKFFWEDEEFCIRPACSATEIIMEGRILHHCVGGDNYLGRHNRGSSYILFLRKADHPEIPYVTVEIKPDGTGICQWYGLRDTKPDRSRIDKWLAWYSGQFAEYGELCRVEQERVLVLATA